MVNDLKIKFLLEDNNRIIRLINEFVDKLTDKNQSVNFYKEYRSAIKPKKDIQYGKKGEFVASAALRRYGLQVPLPDLEIRPIWSKGWDCDLPNSIVNIHVKTCPGWLLGYVGDYSWSFQFGPRGGRDKIFDLPEEATDLVVLVYQGAYETAEGIIKAIAPWSIIRKSLILPKKPEHRDRSRCINYEDLNKYEITNWFSMHKELTLQK